MNLGIRTPAKVTSFQPPPLPRQLFMARTRIQAVSGRTVLRSVSGISESEQSGWYRVNFDKPFLAKPTVVANAEMVSGTWTDGSMTAPQFNPPQWPTINLANELGEATYGTWRKFFENLDAKQRQFFTWTFPPGAKEIRDTLTKIIWAVFDLLKDDFWMMGGRIGSKMDTILNQYDPQRFADYNQNVKYGVDQLTGLSQQAMNSALPQLYTFIGMPKGLKISPVNIRNVTVAGFEFLGLADVKLTVHWIAVGPVTEEEATPPTSGGEGKGGISIGLPPFPPLPFLH